MEKIMRKTNDTSKFGHATLKDHRTLADSELDAVSGGLVVISIIHVLVGSAPGETMSLVGAAGAGAVSGAVGGAA
jgi:hypothetical protein